MLPVLAVSPWGMLAAPDEAFGGASAFEFESGRQRALIAVRPVDYRQGRRLDVVGLRSEGDRLSAADLDRALMKIAAGFDADVLAMTTQVPHVIRACLRHQWMGTGIVMLKVVKNVI